MKRLLFLLLFACSSSVPKKESCSLVGQDFFLRYLLLDGDCPFAEVSEWGPVKLTPNGFDGALDCAYDNSVTEACVTTYNSRCEDGSTWVGQIDIQAGSGQASFKNKTCHASFAITIIKP